MKFKIEVTMLRKALQIHAIAGLDAFVKSEVKRFNHCKVSAFAQTADGFEAVVTINELSNSGLLRSLAQQVEMLCLVTSRALSTAGKADKVCQILYDLNTEVALKQAFPGDVAQCSTFSYNDKNVYIIAKRIGKAPTQTKLADLLTVKLSEAGQLVLSGLVYTNFMLEAGSLDQFRCGEKEKDVTKFFSPVTELLHEAKFTSDKRSSGTRYMTITGAFMSRNPQEAIERMLSIAEALRKLWAPAYTDGYKPLRDNILFMQKNGTKHMRARSVAFNMTEIPKIAVLR